MTKNPKKALPFDQNKKREFFEKKKEEKSFDLELITLWKILWSPVAGYEY